jgi:hypothetical protein
MILHLIWISALISFIWYLIKAHNDYELDIGDYLISFFSSIIVAVSTLGIIVIASLVIDHNSNKELIQTDTKIIYALNDNTSTNGQSFLFSGYVKEELVYRMFVNENGGKKSEEIKSATATIYEEDETCDRYIETYKYIYKNNFVKWLLGEYTWDDTTYKIHIPKGSITTEYKLDLK